MKLYRCYDASGALLYVGRSINALRRLGEHLRDQDWRDDVAQITIQKCGSAGELELFERTAIRHEHPRFNLHHRDDGKTAYIGIKIDPKLKRQVELDAKRKNILVSEFIRNALRRAVAEAR